MRKYISLVLSALLFAMPILAGQEVDKTKMSAAHRQVYDASLALYGEEGQVGHFLCTATVVAARPGEYLLLTAGHCVTGDGLPEDLKFFVADHIVDQPIVGNHDLEPVEVVRAVNNTRYDFAILHLVTLKNYPIVPISNKIPKIEDKVYTVNYSLGVVKQVALGRVATDVITNQGSEGDCSVCQGRYMVQLFAGPGASGAAIIDEKTNEIVGVGEFVFPGVTMGLGCETTPSLLAWLQMSTPVGSIPKAQSLQVSNMEQR